MTTTADSFRRAASLEELYGLLEREKIGPGWNKPTPSLYPQPKREFIPAYWSYAIAKAALDTAGRFVSTELAERRNLILANPVPGNTYATTRTLVAAYQMVKGGEAVRCHRHSPNALRLALDSNTTVYTVVQGEKIPMLPGDVLLTPNWLWHGHSNESRDDAYWIDFLDAPLVQYLDPMFFEHHEERIESADRIVSGSPLRLAYEDTGLAVRRSDPYAPGARRFELGPPYLDTIGLALWHFERGAVHTEPRTTVSRIFAVIAGRGAAVSGHARWAWSRGDVFVVPAWHPLSWSIEEEACLLCVSDEPVLKKLGWLRTEGSR